MRTESIAVEISVQYASDGELVVLGMTELSCGKYSLRVLQTAFCQRIFRGSFLPVDSFAAWLVFAILVAHIGIFGWV